tara:strand:+ start:1096 stop:1245 length:150 start_codon:yes stop_codon:yes gene_type:complete
MLRSELIEILQSFEKDLPVRVEIHNDGNTRQIQELFIDFDNESITIWPK